MPNPAKPSTTPRPRPMKTPPPATNSGQRRQSGMAEISGAAANYEGGPAPVAHGSPVPAVNDPPVLAAEGQPFNADESPIRDGDDSSVVATPRAAKLVVNPMVAAAADPVPILNSEGGYVTAETALLLPVLLGIGYALALVVLLAADQIRCGDAAWEAARALARGVSATQLSGIAARYAPSGAHVSAWSEDGSLTVEVDRDQSIASRFLPSIRISATATVPCEPRVDGCRFDSSDVVRRPNG